MACDVCVLCVLCVLAVLAVLAVLCCVCGLCKWANPHAGGTVWCGVAWPWPRRGVVSGCAVVVWVPCSGVLLWHCIHVSSQPSQFSTPIPTHPTQMVHPELTTAVPTAGNDVCRTIASCSMRAPLSEHLHRQTQTCESPQNWEEADTSDRV